MLFLNEWIKYVNKQQRQLPQFNAAERCDGQITPASAYSAPSKLANYQFSPPRAIRSEGEIIKCAYRLSQITD